MAAKPTLVVAKPTVVSAKEPLNQIGTDKKIIEPPKKNDKAEYPKKSDRTQHPKIVIIRKYDPNQQLRKKTTKSRSTTPDETNRKNSKLLATADDFLSSSESVETNKTPMKQTSTNNCPRYQNISLKLEDIGLSRSCEYEINGHQSKVVAQTRDVNFSQLDQLSQYPFQKSLSNHEIYRSPFFEQYLFEPPEVTPFQAYSSGNKNADVRYPSSRGPYCTSIQSALPLRQNQALLPFYDPQIAHLPPNNYSRQWLPRIPRDQTFQGHSIESLNETEIPMRNFNMLPQQESHDHFITHVTNPSKFGCSNYTARNRERTALDENYRSQEQQVVTPLFQQPSEVNDFIGFSPFEQKFQQFSPISDPLQHNPTVDVFYSVPFQRGHHQNGQALVTSDSDPNRGQTGINEILPKPFEDIYAKLSDI